MESNEFLAKFQKSFNLYANYIYFNFSENNRIGKLTLKEVFEKDSGFLDNTIRYDIFQDKC